DQRGRQCRTTHSCLPSTNESDVRTFDAEGCGRKVAASAARQFGARELVPSNVFRSGFTLNKAARPRCSKIRSAHLVATQALVHRTVTAGRPNVLRAQRLLRPGTTRAQCVTWAALRKPSANVCSTAYREPTVSSEES